MEIKKTFDVSTGGWRLTYGKGRRKLQARVWYSAKLDRYVLAGDINRRTIFMRSAIKAFEDFVKDPEKYDPGKPPTVGETDFMLPPGLDPAIIWEAPRCKSRKGRFRAVAWYKARCKEAKATA